MSEAKTPPDCITGTDYETILSGAITPSHMAGGQMGWDTSADAPLTPAEAMRCPDVADLITQMHRVMWEGDAHSREIARAALAPFTTS